MGVGRWALKMAPKETILNDFNGRVSWKSTGPSLAKIKERNHTPSDAYQKSQFKFEGDKVLGQRFPLVEEVEECPPLVLKYFKGKKDVRLKELEDIFVGCSDKEDSWKMGLIFLIYQYLFASDNRRKISLRIFHMVEDMEMFLQFPWGKKKNWNKKGICDVTYTIHGFALAFQVWTYELIDTFVPNFAEKTLEDDLTSPRIVLYKSFRSYTGPEVSTVIQECTVRRKIHESAEEKRMYSGDDFEDMTNNIYDEFFGCDTRKRKIEVLKKKKNMKGLPNRRPRRVDILVPRSLKLVVKLAKKAPLIQSLLRRLLFQLCLHLDVNEIKSEIKLMKDNQQLIITLLGQRNEQKNGGGEEKEEAGTAAIDTEKRTTKRKNNNLTLVENRTKRKNDDVDNENRTKRKNDELMNSKRKNDDKMKKTEDDDEITRKRNERKERRERVAILSKKKIDDELDKKRNVEKLAKKRKAEKRKSKKNDDSRPTPKTSRKLVFDGPEEKNDDVHENKEVVENKEKEENKEEEDLPHVTNEKKEEVEKEIVKEKKSKQLGEYTDPGGKGFKLNDPVKVNPLLRIDEEKMKELKKWLKSDANDFKELTGCSAGRSLFNRLLKPQQWLHDTEIDEICHLLKRRVEEFLKTYPRNFSIADSKFSQKMNNRYDMFTPNPAGYEFDDLMEYVVGEEKHWVLCKIHLQDWCIYVYDYEQNMFPNDEYDKFLKPMCVMVPYLLEQGFTTGDKQRFPQIKLDTMPYSIIPHPIVLKTTKSGDCRVFTIMHLEYLTASLDISNVVTENMNFWRNKWAVRLFHQIVNP
ncbi:uncharacterized protein LOC124924871 [Impatiens glandulifera]|uniref:uncharacterized protein LOC124924871 n=1 Tax=Impatiens glandulifera TaxID=253017 RepID=UPI001FB149CD|nr:uncharacterized protein LOC124924871 [Impatiens glandulifera]